MFPLFVLLGGSLLHYLKKYRSDLLEKGEPSTDVSYMCSILFRKYLYYIIYVYDVLDIVFTDPLGGGKRNKTIVNVPSGCQRNGVHCRKMSCTQRLGSKKLHVCWSVDILCY